MEQKLTYGALKAILLHIICIIMIQFCFVVIYAVFGILDPSTYIAPRCYICLWHVKFLPFPLLTCDCRKSDEDDPLWSFYDPPPGDVFDMFNVLYFYLFQILSFHQEILCLYEIQTNNYQNEVNSCEGHYCCLANAGKVRDELEPLWSFYDPPPAD